MQMPLHILHHDDGIIHDKPHCKNDGQQGEKVHAESADYHDEGSADQRDRNGDHRDEDGTE